MRHNGSDEATFSDTYEGRESPPFIDTDVYVCVAILDAMLEQIPLLYTHVKVGLHMVPLADWASKITHYAQLGAQELDCQQQEKIIQQQRDRECLQERRAKLQLELIKINQQLGT